jgi:hypothetical protein
MKSVIASLDFLRELVAGYVVIDAAQIDETIVPLAAVQELRRRSSSEPHAG